MKKIVFAAVLALLLSGAAVAQDFPRAEVFAGYSMLKLGLSDNDLNQIVDSLAPEASERSITTSKLMKRGFNGSVAFNITPVIGIVGDLRYNTNDLIDATITLPESDSVEGKIKLSNLSLMAGPRFSYRKNERVTPFAHALIGLDHQRVSREVADVVSDASETNNGLGLALGGGIDVNVSDNLAIRLVQADYYLTRHSGESVLVPNGDKIWNNMSFAFGVVFRIED